MLGPLREVRLGYRVDVTYIQESRFVPVGATARFHYGQDKDAANAAVSAETKRGNCATLTEEEL